MTITCPSCHRALPTSAINLERLLGKCDACNRLFDCSKQLPGPGHAVGVKLRRASVPLPKGMHIELSGAREGVLPDNYRSGGPAVTGLVTITRRWFTSLGSVLFKIWFLIGWFGFLVFWYTSAISIDAPLPFLLFPLIHVGVGLGLVYWVLVNIFNSSIITADAQSLSIRHGPIPAGGDQQIPVAAIEQLYCRELKLKNGVRYAVMVRLVDGREITLVDRLPESEQALFIEQQIEAHLRIVDVEVEDEL